jgi:hypothetical protein
MAKITIEEDDGLQYEIWDNSVEIDFTGLTDLQRQLWGIRLRRLAEKIDPIPMLKITPPYPYTIT